MWDLWRRGELGVAFERKKRLGVLSTAKVTIQGELISLGVLTHDGSSTTASLAKAMVGRSSVHAVQADIEAQRAAWLDLQTRWTAWQQANLADADLLFEQARAALAFATDSTN